MLQKGFESAGGSMLYMQILHQSELRKLLPYCSEEMSHLKWPRHDCESTPKIYPEITQ